MKGNQMFIVRTVDGQTKLFRTVKPDAKLNEAKPVACITVAGAVMLEITDQDEWVRPTEEQLENLRTTFAIDIQLQEDN